MSITGSRDFARRRLVDAGTARGKLMEAKAAHAAALAKRDDAHARRHLTNAFSRQQADAAVSHTAWNVRKATEADPAHMATVKDTMRAVRKAEASLPPEVRATVRPQKQGKASLGSSPEARAKMAAVKARLPELRAAREARLQRQLTRSETRAVRDREMRYNNASVYRGPVAESQARATRSGNRAWSALKRMVGAKAASAANAASEPLETPRAARSIGPRTRDRRRGNPWDSGSTALGPSPSVTPPTTLSRSSTRRFSKRCRPRWIRQRTPRTRSRPTRKRLASL